MSDPGAKPVKFGTKLALLASFGGLLLLMVFSGIDSIRVLHRIETDHSAITETYVARRDAVNRLRAAVWLSGSVVRDCLLQPKPSAAASALARAKNLRPELDSAIEQYSRLANSSERPLLAGLRSELEAYWTTIGPSLRWSAEEKDRQGYSFLGREVFPRRAAMLEIVDQIDALNEQALNTDDKRSAELFTSFRRRTIAMLAVTLAIGVALAAVSIVYILRLEREARLRFQQILRARGELERLSAGLVQAHEEERRAISRELHDEVGQSLSALLVDIGNLAAMTPSAGNPEATRMLVTVRKLAEEAVNSVRNMSLLLRPSMLDDFGLVPAVNWQAREISRRTNMHVSVTANGVADELPDAHNTCVYRVVQEALHNCARHSEAKTVRIVVTQNSDRLRLMIDDDGKGFDSKNTRGLGLVGMEERVRHLGGVLSVESTPGSGTVVKVELPLAPQVRIAPARV